MNDPCDCCGFPDPVGGLAPRKRRNPFVSDEKAALVLCQLCAGTEAGLASDFGYANHQVLKTICFVGNQLRRDLAERNS